MSNGKASTVADTKGNYRLTFSPVNGGSLQLTITNANHTVVHQSTVDILALAHALEIATGAETKEHNGTTVSLV